MPPCWAKFSKELPDEIRKTLTEEGKLSNL
jgi:hypothetical protein